MLIFLLLLLSLGILGFYPCQALSEQDDSFPHDEYALAMVFVSVMLVMGLLDPPNKHRKGNRGCTIQRHRRSVSSIMYGLGGDNTLRCYRMADTSFWKLHLLLKEKIDNPAAPSQQARKRKRRGGPPNGPIESSSRLCIALRYFAGGDPHDIAQVHGVSHTEVFKSVWKVVNAVHQTPALDICFPTDHAEQTRIAREFQEVSDANFGNCVGAIGGILIWINKPTKEQCEVAKCGPKEFFCGRKMKFGLNMQGTCDKRGRFLDVSIYQPGATSDYLAFITSPLHSKLEQPGFLAPGLALFGDNAYVNSNYMVTPFKHVSDGTKDAYNFFHSQLRVRVECGFGMLVKRWALLRKPIPTGISLPKITSLVTCLCKLQNFCIDNNELHVPESTAQDLLNITIQGGIPLEGPNSRPSQVLEGGHHHNDVGRLVRAQHERAAAAASGDGQLPRDVLLRNVEDKQLQRPETVGPVEHKRVLLLTVSTIL